MAFVEIFGLGKPLVLDTRIHIFWKIFKISDKIRIYFEMFKIYKS